MKGYGHVYNVYKKVKLKMMNGNAKSFLCVREMEDLETLNQMK